MKEGKIRKLPFRTPVCHSEPAYHSARPLVIPSLPRNPSPFCVVTTSRCFDFAQHDSLFPHSEHALLSFRTPSCHSAHPLVIPSLPRNLSPFCVVTTSRCFDFAQHDSLFPYSEHTLLSFRTPSCHSEPARNLSYRAPFCHSARPPVIPSLPRNLSPFCVVTTSRCFDFAQHDSLFPHSEPVCHSEPAEESRSSSRGAFSFFFLSSFMR